MDYSYIVQAYPIYNRIKEAFKKYCGLTMINNFSNLNDFFGLIKRLFDISINCITGDILQVMEKTLSPIKTV